jgi:hypothetical protein
VQQPGGGDGRGEQPRRYPIHHAPTRRPVTGGTWRADMSSTRTPTSHKPNINLDISEWRKS